MVWGGQLEHPLTSLSLLDPLLENRVQVKLGGVQIAS